MQTAAPYDWTRFEVHMHLPCAAEQAYDFWATAAGMERFFAHRFSFSDSTGGPRKPTHRAQVGDAYHLAFHHPAELDGEVQTAEPGKRFAFSFGPMRVEVSFTAAADHTLVRLEQSDIPTDAAGQAHSHLNCRSCWVYYLLNLRSVVEHGHDLRDAGLPDNPVGIEFGRRWQESQS
jgi:uncharacterized protein YndB with AHSA1/START domain